MRQLVVALLAGVVVAGTVAFSRNSGPGGLQIASEARNPWTHARLNNNPRAFQFAIVSDRTGGHREKVFSRAVDRLNLLQPEFVLSVGDLIEGGKKAPKAIEQEWEEFDGYVKKLTMPFFYVPGNHDVGNEGNDKIWEQRLGRRHYHFVYRDVLFLCLNTDDPPGAGAGNLGNEQVAYARKVLAANRDVRWTLVFLHKPIWTASTLKKNGWLAVEEALADRPYTVFCGHVHRYTKYIRQGRAYYQLATTGGGSKMRGQEYGEFDHIFWVTMQDDGPVIANLMLDTILDDELQVPASSEKGVARKMLPTHPVRGMVYLDGVPLVGAVVVFQPDNRETRARERGDAITAGDGSFVLSSYRANDGLPEGKYTATVTLRRPLIDPTGKPGPNLIPPKYSDMKTSDLKVDIVPGPNEVRLELKR
ncbi:MAG: metallophosphoesterase [Gemmataceae bacterium]